jgi:hypothetical protein
LVHKGYTSLAHIIFGMLILQWLLPEQLSLFLNILDV